MRSFVLCTLLLALAAASAQAGGVKARRTSAVQYSCDVQGIVEQVSDIVNESVALWLDVQVDFTAINRGVVSCASKDLKDPVSLVKCVVEEARTEVKAVFTAVKAYLADLKTSASALETKLRQCTQL